MALLLLPASAADAADGEPVWTVEDDQDIRRVRFRVDDADCAYRIIADPKFMSERIPHVRGYEVHESKPGYMDLSITEIFVKMARGTSRYHRHFNGTNTVRWKLTAGRQKVHDGEWVVTADKTGAFVDFSNRIEAKSRFHQRLILWVQKVTMREIVKATRKHCGEG
jgi:ribosome-associated toxin RatA of RatAB toxin-antitoxin module